MVLAVAVLDAIIHLDEVENVRQFLFFFFA